MRTNLKKIQRCPGCGDFFILLALQKALKNLGIPKHKYVIVSWIWCSGKMPHYIDWYAAETLHWRILPFATGIKLSNPELTVIWIGWDWDGYGIGLSHFIHTARRNIDLLYIVANNQNYGLTTWQASPTTPKCAKTSSTPQGNPLPPMDPIALAKAAGAEFTYRVDHQDINKLAERIAKGIQHPGFAHLDVDQACPSWRKW